MKYLSVVAERKSRTLFTKMVSIKVGIIWGRFNLDSFDPAKKTAGKYVDFADGGRWGLKDAVPTSKHSTPTPPKASAFVLIRRGLCCRVRFLTAQSRRMAGHKQN